ncbi:LysE family transporter [Paeniglutamicibacter gangotriensis]|uniref:Homoserine/threonine efflux protein n=2 Tax=Paeniglutamicibacter gangotriensis TaxID=254787 RepID=M7MUY2_9MICC|nr:LysE family transporter [Paeniglutamicibacter gangotriensis]EMQ98836.1 homoserine/threonine efflux protein [Paeniglutamicibacter gangotriensis Lz1y]KAA0973703.1 lysine transporter LysE [Paeniglutamicibacter gangotriensis]
MTLSLWLSLLGASTLISFTPGAGAINTMTNSLNSGFRRSLWGIMGQQAALLIHVMVVAAGVGLLVSRSPMAFTLIRYAGAAYLVYLGVRLILAKAQGADDIAVQGRESAVAMFRRGLWVNLLNPKAIVFFLAFTPQFIRLDAPALPQYLIFIGTIIVVDIVVMWLFFAASAKSFSRFTATERGQRILNLCFGTLFIFVAALLIFIH